MIPCPHILIAEDDRHTLAGLITIFEQEGYEVTGVDRGQKALRALECERFDILLTDREMPDIDGMQLFERSQPLAPKMKTIVMTAYSSGEAASIAKRCRVYAYLTKPLNLDKLFITIRKAIAEQSPKIRTFFSHKLPIT